MDSQYASSLHFRSPLLQYLVDQYWGVRGVILVVSIVSVVYILWVNISKFQPEYPILGRWDEDDLQEIIGKETARAMKEKNPRIYALRMPIRDILVVPNSLLKDYGWAAEDQVSSSIDLHERVLGDYTLLGSTTPEKQGDRMNLAISYAKGPLTRQQGPLLSQVVDEIESAFNEDVPECKDWKSLPAHDFAVRLNLRIYQRLYVGSDLGRDKAWMDACVTYSGTIAAAAAALAQYRPWGRPLTSYFVRELGQLRKERQNLVRLLKPHHQDRLKRLSTETSEPDRPYDFIEHYIQNTKGSAREDTTALAVALAGINFAGITSTGGVLVQALYDLAARPEYIQPLRDEIEAAIAEDKTSLQTTAGLAKLTRLDSFIKESQRFTHNNLLSVYRKIRKPLVLSNGRRLPPNSYVAVAGSANARINDSGEPAKFDGFRWSKLREKPENKGKYLGVSTSEDAVEFGYGSHACPGRFLASNIVKLSLAAVLLRFDIKPGQGFDGEAEDGVKRPAPSYNALCVLKPNSNADIMLKQRTKAKGKAKR